VDERAPEDRTPVTVTSYKMIVTDGGRPHVADNGGRGSASRLADARAASATPSDTGATADAFRVVLTYTITDAFALTVEESLWVSYHLTGVLQPLRRMVPSRLPLAVRHELLEQTYSERMNTFETRDHDSVALPADPEVTAADLDDWAIVIAETVTSCYPLRPITESGMYGQITGLLRELGVGHPTNPRAARYLPNAVKTRIATSFQ
jgi:hypothetical protein